ncbi:MAG: phosphatase PAP2 family protein [Planctomycetaceae bacterium]
MICAAGSLLIFCVLTVIVLSSLLQSFDESVLVAVRNPGDMQTVTGPVWLTELWRAVTQLGGYAVLTGVTVLVCLGLHLKQNQKTAVSFAGTVLGGYLLNVLLKAVIARPRPTVVPALADCGSSSFPSGHAMLATIVFLSLGLMLAERLQRRLMRNLVTGLASVIAVAVGVSRVCLGVHYPSDVVAGLCVGLAWTLICRMLVCRRLTRDRTVPDADTADHSSRRNEMS